MTQESGKRTVGSGAGWSGVLRRVALVVGLTLVGVATAHAGLPPTLGAKVSLMAREQSLPAFLQQMFSQIDVPLIVSPRVEGVVNGRFQGVARDVLKKLTRNYSLVSYFDGAVLHVVSMNELDTKAFALEPDQSARVIRAAQELGLLDDRQFLRTTPGGSLMASGVPRFLLQIEDLVKADGRRLPSASIKDAANANIGFRVFYLRHGWAHDVKMAFGGKQLVVPGVASILRRLTGGLGQTVAQSAPLVGAGASGIEQQNTAGANESTRSTLPSLRGKGLSDTDRTTTLGESASQEGSDASANGTALQGMAAPKQGQMMAGWGMPQRVVFSEIGGVKVEADSRSNAVIVRDIVDRLPMYERLIAALDIEPKMIEVEATIVDVNITRLQQLGINWRWINGRNDVLFGNGSASDVALNPGQTITALARGAAVSTVIGSGANFISRINALAADGAARVVSRPQLTTLSNVEAQFDNTSTFYVRLAGRDEVDLFNISAGTSLRVTPDVHAGKIRLLVNVEDGAITPQTVDSIPVVERSTVNTQAMIREGESLLIGGMTRESSNESLDRVPGLGDVPVLGTMFRNKGGATARYERLILLTPRVLSTDASPVRVTTLGSEPLDSPVPAPESVLIPPSARVQSVESSDLTPLRYEWPSAAKSADGVLNGGTTQ